MSEPIKLYTYDGKSVVMHSVNVAKGLVADGTLFVYPPEVAPKPATKKRQKKAPSKES